MSDLAEQTPVDDPTVETGGEIESGEQTVEPTPEPWDGFSEYADAYVPVKVDGEEQLVRLGELPEAYMRHADYTQKTQALADERAQLAQARVIYDALETDPQRAIELLQHAYLAGQAAGDPEGEPEFLTEEERKIHEIESWIADQEQERQAQAVKAELDGLVSKYGVDEAALVDFAIKTNAPSLTTAYALMRLGEEEAQATLQRQTEEANAARQAAAQQAQIVEGGTGRNPAATAQPAEYATLDEAWEAAVRQHGL